MKVFIKSILAFYILISFACAQNNIHLNYIEYKTTFTDMVGKSYTPFNIKIWYNDTISYNMRWSLPTSITPLNKVGLPYTKQDSIDNRQYIESLAESFNQQKNTTRCINANSNTNMYIVDYDINIGNPYYYIRKPYKNYLSNIVLIEDTAKMILGKICKLAIGTFTYYNDSSTETRKIWYAANIKAPFGPDYFMKNIPGLVMEIEAEKSHYFAIAIDETGKTAFNSDFDVPAKYYHSHDDYLLEFEKYRQRNQRITDKQKKEKH